MKLEDIHQKIKVKSIRASEETFRKLKIIGAHTGKSQNQILTEMVDSEFTKLNITKRM